MHVCALMRVCVSACAHTRGYIIVHTYTPYVSVFTLIVVAELCVSRLLTAFPHPVFSYFPHFPLCAHTAC